MAEQRGPARFNFINKMPLLCKLTELTECYETWEMQAIPVLQAIVGHHSQKESQPIVFVFEKGKAYTMWKSVGTSELLGQS